MFETGKHYTIEMTNPTDPGMIYYFHGKVLDFQFPLLKILENSGGEKIINTSSPLVHQRQATSGPLNTINCFLPPLARTGKAAIVASVVGSRAVRDQKGTR
jgi:hypothetical protein